MKYFDIKHSLAYAFFDFIGVLRYGDKTTPPAVTNSNRIQE